VPRRSAVAHSRRATRDALIADKIGKGEWRAHIGQSPSPFVNAATWGLLITGRLVGTFDETGLGATLTKLIARSGAPIIRASVDTAMRVMGEQFVCGQTIEAALDAARKHEAQGFRYSYDMLGEAAATAEDAARYLTSYTNALHAIGAASAGRGIYEGPGLSIKLSALHPRYQRAQRRRVLEELLPRLKSLAALARHYDVGINIDAEESERLDLSLDLLEALCRDKDLAGWNGVGFVVQAYQKRSAAVLAGSSTWRAAHQTPHHAPAGQGRLLGQRDQARAGGRPRGLSGVHAQDPHRCLLSRLRAAAARRRPTRSLSAIRHP
jgi:RHH-type proline utilization regulon transcriptional repressor/proline dehydrogenase/delta 1-pyrroline-5-carboxylate dehydrogenase